jgi:hypothetical protein
LALLAFVRRGFADATVGAQLRRGATRLVLIVPDDDAGKLARGRAWGAFFMHASDAELAPLADVEVVCATAAQVGKLATSTPPPDTLLALVARDGTLAGARAGGLPKNADAQIGFLAARVRGLLGRGPADAARAAASVRTRLVAQAPPGSHWANASACGYPDVEGMSDPEADEKIAIDCGMGMVPDKSARFLYFWTQTPARRALQQEGQR